MSPAEPSTDTHDWPPASLSALRLGRRLVVEVPGSAVGRRAFVDIRASITGRDDRRPRPDPSFVVQHRDYAADRVAGFDYDIGAVLVRSARAADFGELRQVLAVWGLPPERFTYPWRTDDPQ